MTAIHSFLGEPVQRHEEAGLFRQTLWGKNSGKYLDPLR